MIYAIIFFGIIVGIKLGCWSLEPKEFPCGDINGPCTCTYKHCKPYYHVFPEFESKGDLEGGCICGQYLRFPSGPRLKNKCGCHD